MIMHVVHLVGLWIVFLLVFAHREFKTPVYLADQGLAFACADECMNLEPEILRVGWWHDNLFSLRVQGYFKHIYAPRRCVQSSDDLMTATIRANVLSNEVTNPLHTRFHLINRQGRWEFFLSIDVLHRVVNPVDLMNLGDLLIEAIIPTLVPFLLIFVAARSRLHVPLIA